MTEKVSTINVKKGDEWETIVPAVAESAIKDGNGQTIALTYAKKTDVPTKTEVATALTDGSVTKVGTATLGSASSPIYLANGVPTVATQVVDTTSAQTVTGAKTLYGTDRLVFKSNKIDMSVAPPEVLTTYDVQVKDKTDANRYIRRHATLQRANGSIDHRTYFYGTASTIGYYEDVTVLADGTVQHTSATALPSDIDNNAFITKGYVASTVQNVNNLVHKDGNETVAGTKTVTSEWNYNHPPQARKEHLKTEDGWHPIYTESANIDSVYRTTVIRFIENNTEFAPVTLVARRRTASQNNFKIDKGAYANRFRMTRTADGECTVWANFVRAVFWIEADIQSTATVDMNNMRLDSRRSTVFSEPTVGEDYAVVLTPTEF